MRLLFKIIVLVYVFWCGHYSADAQVLGKKSEVDYYPNEAYLKSYLQHHPDVAATLVYNNVKSAAYYEGLFEVEKVYGKKNVEVEKYTALKNVITGFIDSLGIKTVSESETSSSSTEMSENKSNFTLKNLRRKNYLDKMGSSDLLIEVSVNRSYIEIAPSNNSFKSLSLLDMKGFENKLSVSIDIYYKHRLMDDRLSFGNTYYGICLAPPPPDTKDDEKGRSSLMSDVKNLVSEVALTQPCTNYYQYMDTVRNNSTQDEVNIDDYLSSASVKHSSRRLNHLLQRIKSDFTPQVQGVITDMSADRKSATIMMSKPVFKKKGKIQMLKEHFEEKSEFQRPSGGLKDFRVNSYWMVAKIKGDDKYTPWVQEKEYVRRIGRIKANPKEKLTLYKGSGKIKELAEGFDIQEIDKVALYDDNSQEWLLTSFEMLESLQPYEITGYAVGGITVAIEEQTVANNKEELLAKQRKINLFRSEVLFPLPASVYYNEANPLLFPNTVVEEHVALSEAPKNEKRSLIARIKRMENNKTKIGVVFALKESYEEKENPNRTVNGKPEIQKKNWKKLSTSFYALGNRMVSRLNEHFNTNVFELININAIPTKEIEISQLIAKVRGVEQNQKTSAFEKTQYPVVAFYELGAILGVTNNKLNSSIEFREFYGYGGQKFLRTPFIKEIVVSVGKNYEEYIDEMKQQEDNAIIDFVKKEESYFSKKVK